MQTTVPHFALNASKVEQKAASKTISLRPTQLKYPIEKKKLLEAMKAHLALEREANKHNIQAQYKKSYQLNLSWSENIEKVESNKLTQKYAPFEWRGQASEVSDEEKKARLEKKAQRAAEMKQAFISDRVAKANKNTVRIIRSKVIKAQEPQDSQLSRELLTLKLTKANENKQKFLDNRKLVALKFSTPGARSQVRETSWIDLKMKKVSEEKQQLLSNRDIIKSQAYTMNVDEQKRCPLFVKKSPKSLQLDMRKSKKIDMRDWKTTIQIPSYKLKQQPKSRSNLAEKLAMKLAKAEENRAKLVNQTVQKAKKSTVRRNERISRDWSVKTNDTDAKLPCTLNKFVESHCAKNRVAKPWWDKELSQTQSKSQGKIMNKQENQVISSPNQTQNLEIQSLKNNQQETFKALNTITEQIVQISKTLEALKQSQNDQMKTVEAQKMKPEDFELI